MSSEILQTVSTAYRRARQRGRLALETVETVTGDSDVAHHPAEAVCE